MLRLKKPAARHRGPAGRRGLALVTVLWVLMLLALIAASFMATTRTEINLTRNLIESAEAEALPDANARIKVENPPKPTQTAPGRRKRTATGRRMLPHGPSNGRDCSRKAPPLS